MHKNLLLNFFVMNHFFAYQIKLLCKLFDQMHGKLFGLSFQNSFFFMTNLRRLPFIDFLSPGTDKEENSFLSMHRIWKTLITQKWT